MQNYLSQDKKRLSIQEKIVNQVEFSLATTRFDFHQVHCYQAVSRSIRDRLIESFNDTQLYFHEQNCKRIYYLSIVFLIGRWLQNAVSNLGLQSAYAEAVQELGYKLEDLYDQEVDPAL